MTGQATLLQREPAPGRPFRGRSLRGGTLPLPKPDLLKAGPLVPLLREETAFCGPVSRAEGYSTPSRAANGDPGHTHALWRRVSRLL